MNDGGPGPRVIALLCKTARKAKLIKSLFLRFEVQFKVNIFKTFLRCIKT